MTGSDGRALTPEYAAPEQLTGGPITTATDVYGLGRLLYVLLGGPRPAAAHRGSAAELFKSIVETDSPRLSSVVPNGKALRGDLDTIVAKALKNAPGRALRVGFRHGGRSAPISPSRAGHRQAGHLRVSNGKILAASRPGGGGLGGRGPGDRVSRRFLHGTVGIGARSRAARSRQIGRISELLTSLLTGSDPYATRDREPTVRNILDAGAERVERELRDQPAVKAELMTVIGRVYQRLGVYDKATPLLEEAAAIGRARGEPTVQLAQTLNDLGVLRRERGDAVGATSLLEEVARDAPNAARTRRQGCGGDARRAWPRVRGPWSQRSRRTALPRSAGNPAQSAWRWAQGNRDEQERAGAAALAARRHRGRRAAVQAVARHQPGGALRRSSERRLQLEQSRTRAPGQGRLRRRRTDVPSVARDQEETFRRQTFQPRPEPQQPGRGASRTRKVRGGPFASRGGAGDHAPDAWATTIRASPASRSISRRVHLAQNDSPAAETLLRDALTGQQRTLAPDDWRLAATKGVLGASLLRQGGYRAAEPLLIEANNVLKDVPGRQGREAAASRESLVALYQAPGRPVSVATKTPRTRNSPKSLRGSSCLRGRATAHAECWTRCIVVPGHGHELHAFHSTWCSPSPAVGISVSLFPGFCPTYS